MSSGRIARALGLALLAAGIAGAAGCDKVRDAVDDIRRSSERNWERGRRLQNGAVPSVVDAAAVRP